MKSLRGSLLIATPQLQDSNFMQSVVLLVEHEEDGALGLILNRPMELTTQQLWQQLDTGPCTVQSAVRSGGPVSGPIMALHRLMQYSDREVLPGLYLTSDRDQLRQLVANGQPPVYVFVGYAGWGPEQLEAEMEVGGWLVLPATADLVLAAHTEDLWQDSIRKTGQHFLEKSLGIHEFPDDPALN